MHDTLSTTRLPGSDDDAPLKAEFTAFDHLRPRLIAVAGRIVGSRDAEDVVQDVWVRWHACDRDHVVNPTAFLVTATTRRAINVAKSARARRESVTLHRLLPEPVDPHADPATVSERRESLHGCLSLLLQRLSPTERGAYVLRHAFEYSYVEIAQVLGTTEINARQLVSRAGKRMSTDQHGRRSTPRPERLMGAFVAAAEHGDVTALEGMFAYDVARLKAS